MQADGFLFQALIYLLAAIVSVPIAKRLGMSSVLGYLLAGVIIGPFVLGFLGRETSDVMHFAEFGVVLMLFLIGLELRPSLLWRLRGSILGLGSLQLVFTASIICVIAVFMDFNWKVSLAIGLILSLSSTAIVLQTLNEKGLMKTEAGRLSFSVLLFQDIAFIPMLALFPFLASYELQTSGIQLDPLHQKSHWLETIPEWQHALLVIAVMSLIVLLGRFLSRYVFHYIAESKSREIFTAFALFLVIASALIMELVGLSAALGTFLAGVVLAESEYRYELESNIEPFKALLLGLFFISVGASIDFSLLRDNPTTIIALLIGLLVTKFCVLFILGNVFKMRVSQNYIFSFGLAQGGEFAFVLFSFATQNSVIPEPISKILILVVALSMIMTPLIMILNEKLLQPRFSKLEDDREVDVIDETNPVVIAGFGRFGQIVGRLLHANNIGTTVLDHKPSQIDTLRRFGYKVFYGDATRIDLLRSAGVDKAKLFIIAIDDKDRALELAKTVKKEYPNLKILARAFDRLHTYEFMEIGVNLVQRETFNSALELGVTALKELGFRSYQAHRSASKFKHHDEESIGHLYHFRSDEKTMIPQAKQKVQELINIIQSDLHEEDENIDHAWEKSGD